MSISPVYSNLSANLVNLLANERLSLDPTTFPGSATAGANFSDILTESLKNASEADTTDKVNSLQLLTGQSDDLSGLLIDMQKAELSLNLALQIRNKLVDAYTEVLRMQV